MVDMGVIPDITVGEPGGGDLMLPEPGVDLAVAEPQVAGDALSPESAAGTEGMTEAPPTESSPNEAAIVGPESQIPPQPSAGSPRTEEEAFQDDIMGPSAELDINARDILGENEEFGGAGDIIGSPQRRTPRQPQARSRPSKGLEGIGELRL
jgi:hypothetical protein